jgi:hypothetical protein
MEGGVRVPAAGRGARARGRQALAAEARRPPGPVQVQRRGHGGGVAKRGGLERQQEALDRVPRGRQAHHQWQRSHRGERLSVQ